MTSKNQEQACYVYITLPEQTTPVTAGKLVIQEDRHGTSIGYFIYGKTYLAKTDAVEIDPIELQLSTKAYQTIDFNGIFGALRDAGPDYWGRRVIERHCGKPQLSELDYLLYSPDDRAGALGFGLNKTPPAPKRRFNKTIDLSKLQILADALIEDEKMPANSTNLQLEDLLLLGTSMGGARPKAVVEDNEGLWIAKFNRYDDKWNQARVEHTMLILARQCGLNVADSKIVRAGNKDVLLVKRFDREKTPNGYLRARMISALTLLKAGNTLTTRDRWSYVYLAEELRRACANPEKDANELYKRMCFNALISNIDDHPRNHAIIAKNRNWQLSPAFDLTPAIPISLEKRDLAMSCGDMGRVAHKDNLLTQHARFLLSESKAKDIIDNMQAHIKQYWYSTARSEGVTEQDCETIVSAFVYPGFSNRS